MANQQQVLFAETIAGMKKALKRTAYQSDSDSDVDNQGNRGQKLKKRARFARRGQLVPTVGPSSYKEAVDYAGVRRSILHRKPPLIDNEGYEVDSDDDRDRLADAVAAAAEFDPYTNIRLENVLAPLTATTNLSSHPTMSKPFTSQTLSDLVTKSCSMMRKENQSLWQVRHLWTTLCGDYTWAPCETMIGENDLELYTEDHVARHLLSLSQSSPTGEPGAASLHQVNGESTAAVDGDISMADGQNTKSDNIDSTSIQGPVQENPAGHDGPRKEPSDVPMQNGDSAGDQKTTVNNKGIEESALQLVKDAAGSDVRPLPQTDGDNPDSVTSEASELNFVHPMFVTPVNAKPDRDAGLPDNEADQLRKLLALYVQKQEEVCRGAQKLHDGLLKAERLRGEVLHWSKAEAHSGPNRDMSDGEDWYDREEWGLTEDLKKGQDEEEEDTTTTGKKTTRARR